MVNIKTLKHYEKFPQVSIERNNLYKMQLLN